MHIQGLLKQEISFILTLSTTGPTETGLIYQLLIKVCSDIYFIVLCVVLKFKLFPSCTIVLKSLLFGTTGSKSFTLYTMLHVFK